MPRPTPRGSSHVRHIDAGKDLRPHRSGRTDRAVEILLVEDNPADVRLTREVLEDGDDTTHLNVVGDGEEAMAFLRREGTYAAVSRARSLVLLDLNLPKKDGREVLEELKCDTELCRIPVVVLTTSAAESDILALVRAARELLHHEAARPRRVLHRRAVDQGLLARERAPAFGVGSMELDGPDDEQAQDASRSCSSRTTPATHGSCARCWATSRANEFDVEHVERLTEARERLMSNGGTGCVLLDLSLPDANRLEALMQLRAAAPDVPIVILSGLQDELLAVKAVQEGAQDYLIKGRVDGEALGRSITYAIERKQSEMERVARGDARPAHGPSQPRAPARPPRRTRSRGRGDTARLMSVMLVDLDRFKLINDSLGQEVGDQVLVEIGHRLEQALRGTDTAARFGGDKFCVLCEEVVDEQHAVRVADRIVKNIEKPMELESDTTFVTASIGIVVATGESVDDPEALVREADAAMFRAKERGVRCELFDAELRTRVAERQEVEKELREAVDREEFRLLYQPQIDLRTGEIFGVEALLRWDHPERGLLAPADFIWLAEETGLIMPIGSWVLKEALEQAQRWRSARPDKPLRLSVNLSGPEHGHPALVETVDRILRNSGTDPSTLCLEISEDVLMSDVETSFVTLRALKDLGVWLSVDDFGTGFSSLSSLKRFPVDSLKVDRSFIAALDGDTSEDAAIVTAVIGLAHTLGMTAVAEGIETAEQLEQVRSLDCDAAQGFYFARPRPATVITELLGAE